jgi:hypothetical protein
MALVSSSLLGAACGATRSEPPAARGPSHVHVPAPPVQAQSGGDPAPPERRRDEISSESRPHDFEMSSDGGTVEIASRDRSVRFRGSFTRQDGGFSFRGSFSAEFGTPDAGP